MPKPVKPKPVPEPVVDAGDPPLRDPRGALEHAFVHPKCLCFKTATKWVGFLPRGKTFRDRNSCNRSYGVTRPEADAKEQVLECLHSAVAAGVV